ncbi:MAG: hypothetical protein CM15mP77_4110 [Synechococcus sp.]|nr:MAG: hypothetical protein CM15mP77_4110 [Synechococcus sp.]
MAIRVCLKGVCWRYPLYYEEIRTSGGGYFRLHRSGGHTHPVRGGALIIKQGEHFFNSKILGEPGARHGAKNTKSQTDWAIEEREDSDLKGDGFIGAPEVDEIEVEVSSVV